jgi:hypothetical protein
MVHVQITALLLYLHRRKFAYNHVSPQNIHFTIIQFSLIAYANSFKFILNLSFVLKDVGPALGNIYYAVSNVGGL